jgi:hypothetical protein
MIDAGVTHLVLAAVPGRRPVEWPADEIVEPVLAEVPQPTGHSGAGNLPVVR